MVPGWLNFTFLQEWSFEWRLQFWYSKTPRDWVWELRWKQSQSHKVLHQSQEAVSTRRYGYLRTFSNIIWLHFDRRALNCHQLLRVTAWNSHWPYRSRSEVRNRYKKCRRATHKDHYCYGQQLEIATKSEILNLSKAHLKWSNHWGSQATPRNRFGRLSWK